MDLKVYESVDRVKEFIEKSNTGYRYYCSVVVYFLFIKNRIFKIHIV